MRIELAHDLGIPSEAALRERVRLALGSHAQAVERVHVQRDGDHFRLRAVFVDGRESELRSWQADPDADLDRLLERLRRSCQRHTRTLTRASSAPLG